MREDDVEGRSGEDRGVVEEQSQVQHLTPRTLSQFIARQEPKVSLHRCKDRELLRAQSLKHVSAKLWSINFSIDGGPKTGQCQRYLAEVIEYMLEVNLYVRSLVSNDGTSVK